MKRRIYKEAIILFFMEEQLRLDKRGAIKKKSPNYNRISNQVKKEIKEFEIKQEINSDVRAV